MFNFKENLLQFIWQYRLYSTPLFTIKNKKIEIINIGQLNNEEGPDFLNSKIKIENIILVGNLEIDLQTSFWKAHKHDINKNYKNIILHIVWKHNAIEHNNIEILELSNFVPKILLNKYSDLMNNTNDILCNNLLKNNVINDLILTSFKDKLIVERLENKVNVINEYLNKTENNWEQIFFITLMKVFGYTSNVEAFEEIAIKTDIRIFAKNKSNADIIYAILFGQAGLLNYNFTDEFCKNLKKEYDYLKIKYGIKPISQNIKFGKIRPVNFPTIRLAQMAALIYKSKHLFSTILESEKISDIIELFYIEINPYFINHYTLNKLSKNESDKKLGLNFIYSIIINAIIPIVFIYGKIHNKPNLCNKALNWLENIPTEKNNIIDKWLNLNFKFSKAYDSQSMIHLYKNYCLQKKCLECNIGYELLKK